MFFCFPVNYFVCNLQRLKRQHAGETANWVVPHHQEYHRIVCMAIQFFYILGGKRSPSYEELFQHSAHAQLKQKHKNSRSRGWWDERFSTPPPPLFRRFLLPSLGNTRYAGYIIRSMLIWWEFKVMLTLQHWTSFFGQKLMTSQTLLWVINSVTLVNFNIQ